MEKRDPKKKKRKKSEKEIVKCNTKLTEGAQTLLYHSKHFHLLETLYKKQLHKAGVSAQCFIVISGSTIAADKLPSGNIPGNPNSNTEGENLILKKVS